MGIVLIAPGLPDAIGFGTFRAYADGAVLIAILFGLTRVGDPPEVPWLGTWRSWGLGAVLATIVFVQAVQAVARYATNDILPLYDVVLLARHLYILGVDLYGGWARVALLGILLSPFGIWVVASTLFARVEGALTALPLRGAAGLAIAMTALGLLTPATGLGRWSTPRIAESLLASWQLYQVVEQEIAANPHRELDATRIGDPPDLTVYVVESYGKVLADDPEYAEPWSRLVDRVERDLEAAGWRTASGYAISPVHSGRSWIADASMLFGLHLAHQTQYEHAIALVDRLPHLPGALAQRGYTTVLVKPSDRARPGVALANPFRFDVTVFAEELGYGGPVIGWGRIPDQYTIGAVNDELLPQLEPPLFAFFHLATAHAPWRVQPPLLPRWTMWRALPEDTEPAKTRSLDSELAMQMSRFKRRELVGVKPRTADETQRANYFASIRHDLLSIRRTHAELPERRSVIVVMGDHQPPLLARDQGAEVPVHVLVSDGTLLDAFLAEGFTPGLRPRAGTELAHEALYPLLIRAMASSRVARPSLRDSDP
ncbi:MAG: hypothetical protein AAF602_16220 [Myxococcota bacterium]